MKNTNWTGRLFQFKLFCYWWTWQYQVAYNFKRCYLLLVWQGQATCGGETPSCIEIATKASKGSLNNIHYTYNVQCTLYKIIIWVLYNLRAYRTVYLSHDVSVSTLVEKHELIHILKYYQMLEPCQQSNIGTMPTI